ncbi:large subunit GTPase 1 homolog isoform X2 [Eurosta solidaginis]|uniref:large subunit GTPase 1 homolog isoform X2 n=1 Tax=Eurosta solidaginis TaxID=178769 RepID=UPI0035310CE9
MKIFPFSELHTTEIQDGYHWGRLNLASVTEESSFHDFLRTAELADTEFQADKLNITFINPKTGVGVLSKSQMKQMQQKHRENNNMLTVPRRPKWTAQTTAEELQRAENESFLEWCRTLALLQEDNDILLTPYEKYLEFWRQLWRVVERSDVVVQIVDARNPLLFRSVDLERKIWILLYYLPSPISRSIQNPLRRRLINSSLIQTIAQLM